MEEAQEQTNTRRGKAIWGRLLPQSGDRTDLEEERSQGHSPHLATSVLRGGDAACVGRPAPCGLISLMLGIRLHRPRPSGGPALT